MTQIQANEFAGQWLAAWNAHALAHIVQHYALNIEFVSPFATKLTGNSLIVGREALTRYFAVALENFPELHFSHMRAFPGEGSVVLCYRSVNDLDAAETMVFDKDGQISRVWAHYRQSQSNSSIG